jgi:glucose-6-phosphate isomerase
MERNATAELPSNDLVNHPSWQALLAHHQEMKAVTLSSLFAKQATRFKHFSSEFAGILFDYSKNLCNEKTVALLTDLAQESHLEEKIAALFSGQIVNLSEKRPALHTALRDLSPDPLILGQKNIKEEIHHCLILMEKWSQLLREKRWLGTTGKAITDVVHIGIGGSHLGPQTVIEALKAKTFEVIHTHFVATVDEQHIQQLLKQLDPETTLFIVVSKTFTTYETLANAKIAKQWLNTSLKNLSSHFIGVTQFPERAINFGINPEFILPLWEWVGGRYSLWSSVGFIIAVALGMDEFKNLLQGAFAMDQHFRHSDFKNNLPVIFALLDLWSINFFKTSTLAVLPYNHHLRLLPAHLQQLLMESNGKSTQQNSKPVNYATSPIVWGGNGSEGQHAYFQLFFQGTHLTPIDFIIALDENSFSQQSLFASCIAQSQTLMQGNLQQPELTTYQKIIGNQVNNTIVLTELNAFALGALLAFYEHRTFVQAALWNINAFDQWGVEQGKRNYKTLLEAIQTREITQSLDSSTQGLIDFYLKKHT